MKNSEKYFSSIYLILGFIFLRSGFEKIEGGKFVGALAGILEKFASKNPYPFYKEFLTNIAIPNSQIFGNLTMWGEFITGLILSLGAIYLILKSKPQKPIIFLFSLGLLGGMLLNGTFWLAAGWTSPSTESLNLVMFLVQAIGFIFVISKLSPSQK